MKIKGVCYDTRAVMGFNWRPRFSPGEVKRELQIMGDDLHCNTVRWLGRAQNFGARFSMKARVPSW
jgi:hypothetical protein